MAFRWPDTSQYNVHSNKKLSLIVSGCILGFNCIECEKNLSLKSQLTHHMATIHSKPCSLVIVWKCFVFKSRLNALWLLCLTVGDQIAAEEPQKKHSLRIEAHNCTKCIKVLSKPTHFFMHRQIHKQLPILTHHMATIHSKPCSLVWKCFVFKRRLTALWLLCLTVGDQIAAQAPHKHSLRIEAHNCTKCVKVFSKPTNFSMHRKIHKQLPLLGFNCILC